MSMLAYALYGALCISGRSGLYDLWCIVDTDEQGSSTTTFEEVERAFAELKDAHLVEVVGGTTHAYRLVRSDEAA